MWVHKAVQYRRRRMIKVRRIVTYAFVYLDFNIEILTFPEELFETWGFSGVIDIQRKGY